MLHDIDQGSSQDDNSSEHDSTIPSHDASELESSDSESESKAETIINIEYLDKEEELKLKITLV